MSLIVSDEPRNEWEAASLVLGGGWLTKSGAVQGLKPLTAEGLFTFSRSSNKWVVTDQNELIEVQANMPGLQYNYELKRWDILIERGVTNGILRSRNSFTNWIVGASLNGSQILVLKKDGIDLIASNDGLIGDENGRTQQSSMAFTLNSGNSYTISFVAKKTGNHSVFGYYLFATEDLGAWFNVDSKASGSIYNSLPCGDRVRKITQLTENEFLCEETFKMTANRTATVFCLAPTNEGGSGSVTAGNRGGFAFPQLEEGSRASSRILTDGSIASRTADILGKTGATTLIGQSEGLIYAKINMRSFAQDGAPVAGLVSLNDGSFNNIISIGIDRQINNRFFAFVSLGGVAQVQLASSTITDGIYTVELAYSANNFKLYVNGVLASSSLLGNVPAVSQISIGAQFLATHIINDGLMEIAIHKTRPTTK